MDRSRDPALLAELIGDRLTGSGGLYRRLADAPKDTRLETGHGESLFHRIAVGPGEVIAMTYAVDPGMPEVAAELAARSRAGLTNGLR